MIIQELAAMRYDLERYAERDNASDAYIERSNKTIATFYQFTQAAQAYMDSMAVETQQAYQRGYDTGYRAAQNEIAGDRLRVPPLLWQIMDGQTRQVAHYDREALRLYSIERAQKSQPHLF